MHLQAFKKKQDLWLAPQHKTFVTYTMHSSQIPHVRHKHNQETPKSSMRHLHANSNMVQTNATTKAMLKQQPSFLGNACHINP